MGGEGKTKESVRVYACGLVWFGEVSELRKQKTKGGGEQGKEWVVRSEKRRTEPPNSVPAFEGLGVFIPLWDAKSKPSLRRARPM